MNKILTFARARLAYWGTRLGIVAALIAGYVASNGGAVEKAINSFVPEPYRPISSMVVGIVVFLLIHSAQTSDANKVAGQWQR
jgi:hypothetical protein